MSIVLKQSLGNVFVWDTNDILTLRKDHHIIGNLVGCLPRCPTQNAQLGAPLQLTKEETTLLLEKGIARLVQDHGVSKPSQKEIDSYSEYRKKSFEEQIIICKQERQKEIMDHLPQIVEGRQRKIRRVDDGSGEVTMSTNMTDDSKEVILPRNVDDTREITVSTKGEMIPSNESYLKDGDVSEITEKHELIQLFTRNPRIQPEIPAEWSYPNTDAETLRYRVFKDFWERGHYLTCGVKFGGDFLVYEGDPARFHAPYIAVCKPYTATLSAQTIVTLGRLGTNVKKAPVLCSLDPNDELCFTSIQWAGNK